MLLIINNRSTYLGKFKREFLSKQNINFTEFEHDAMLKLYEPHKVKGVILSGGMGHPYGPLNLSNNFIALSNFKVPVLGLCLGMEIMVVNALGSLRKLSTFHSKMEEIHITAPDDPIFSGLDSQSLMIQKSHSYQISDLPRDFVNLAHSKCCDYEIIRHKTLPWYGFQGHPEVSGVAGLRIMRNFFDLCGL